ncbi:MAG: lytic transglycosylase domain-containing protein [Bacteroidetes bacterium]|nr:lytic transglycosylase domain-containing protein [Bacteroidota bacterium]
MKQKFFQLKSFFSIHTFKFSAGLAVAMLFTISIMSFTDDSHYNMRMISSMKDSTDSIKKFKNLLPDDSNISSNMENVRVALNPQAVSFVNAYIKREKTDLTKMKDWAKPYFALYDKILTENGIPVQMKYLSVIESSLQPNLVSWAGAKGPWQLMPDEAKRYGLLGKNGKDGRTDFTQSTIAACKLMNELYDEFGNWMLVVAAYNAGEGGVRKAINKAGSDNFWDIQYYLPTETRNHVKKFIATQYFFEGSGGLTTMTVSEIKNYKNTQASLAQTENTSPDGIVSIPVEGKYLASVIASNLEMDLTTFNKLNPAFNGTMKSGKQYSLNLPEEKADIFQARKQIILKESVANMLSNANLSL